MFTEDVSVNLLDVLLFSSGKTRNHTHARSFWALSFRLNSDNCYIYNGKKLVTKTGDIAVVPAGLTYDRITESSDAIVFHFDMFGFVSEDIEVFTPEDPEKYRALFDRALDIWKEKSPGFKYRATAVLYEIIAQLEEDGALSGEINDKRIADAADYMKRNFADTALSIESLAREACMCDTLFRRKFKACLGMSPKKYLERIRMEYAMQLLGVGYFSHEQISEKCGYTNVKYFRTAFKTYVGRSISSYLKEN